MPFGIHDLIYMELDMYNCFKGVRRLVESRVRQNMGPSTVDFFLSFFFRAQVIICPSGGVGTRSREELPLRVPLLRR